MSQSTFPPPETERILVNHGGDQIRLFSHRGFVIGRLLEEGDTRDLRWLTDHVPEQELLTWLKTHGGRRLSRRSLAFWATLLREVDATDSRPPHIDDLWPL